MEYLLPKDISSKFWISLKTVYNYLTKYKDKIRIRKENWKRFVNYNDLQKILQNDTKAKDVVVVEGSQKQDNADFVNLQNDLQSLQSKTNDLQKYNNNLQEQVGKYALMLSDEKNEKKDLLQKYDELQTTHSTKIEEFGKEKVRYTKKFYLLLGIVFVLVVLSVVFFSLYYFDVTIGG